MPLLRARRGRRINFTGAGVPRACPIAAFKSCILRGRAGKGGVVSVTISRAWILPAAALAVCAGVACSGEALARVSVITMDRAIQIALKARPGAITAKELEREKGGSGLRFSFDIKSGGRTYEVGVDAADGKVLENGP